MSTLLTYLLFLKERGFLNASLGCAIEIVLPSLDVRLKSPNALWRLYPILPESRPKSTGLVSRYSWSYSLIRKVNFPLLIPYKEKWIFVLPVVITQYQTLGRF